MMRRVRRLFHKSREEKQLDAELRFHIERQVADYVAAGMIVEDAQQRARNELGGIERVKVECREARKMHYLEDLIQDLQLGLRLLRKNPGFTAIVVLTLAIGIGANAAIFSVVNAVLLKPLPYPNPDQLVIVLQARPQDGIPSAGWSYLNFQELREQNRSFSELAGVTRHQLTLTGRGDPSIVYTNDVTPEIFAVLGEKPLAGRTLLSDDGKPGAPAVVVLGETLWRGPLGGDPKIIGSSIQLDKREFTVVGIMPAGFRFPVFTESQQLWIPIAQDPLFGPWMPKRGTRLFSLTGRLKPGVSAMQAQADLDTINARLAKEFPAENGGWIAVMSPLQKLIVGNVRPALLVLLGAVGLVLLIACANIANLLLTRATSRSREIAVRTALGAGRNRIVRQLLSETAVLGLLGGIAGIVLAYWAVQGLSSFVPASVPRANDIRVDGSVLGFALLLSATASFAFGLAPALFAARTNLQISLREGGGRSGESKGRRRARKVLASGEIALAMVLLVAAGLLLRSFANLMSVKPGFESEHILKTDVSLPRFQYKTPQQWSVFTDEMLARLQAEPGLQDTAAVAPLPVIDRGVNLTFDIAGSPKDSQGTSRTADYVSVSPNYFHVMGIPLIAGRFFNEHDIFSGPRVTVISETMARRYFPNQNPLGRRLQFAFPPDSGVMHEIVGIVGDVRDVSLSMEPGPMMYVPFAQEPFWGSELVVKTTLSPAGTAAAIRREVRKIDKDLPVSNVQKMPDVIEASVAQPKFRTFLLGLLAAMALVLAATGIFGVISYSVSCRTQEIGIRVALGASQGAVLRMILRETLVLAIAGLAIGIPCALAAARLIGHMLFGVSADDPATIAVVALGLAAVASLAGYVPARRAMGVDPLVALRHE